MTYLFVSVPVVMIGGACTGITTTIARPAAQVQIHTTSTTATPAAVYARMAGSNQRRIAPAYSCGNGYGLEYPYRYGLNKNRHQLSSSKGPTSAGYIAWIRANNWKGLQIGLVETWHAVVSIVAIKSKPVSQTFHMSSSSSLPPSSSESDHLSPFHSTPVITIQSHLAYKHGCEQPQPPKDDCNDNNDHDEEERVMMDYWRSQIMLEAAENNISWFNNTRNRGPQVPPPDYIQNDEKPFEKAALKLLRKRLEVEVGLSWEQIKQYERQSGKKISQAARIGATTNVNPGTKIIGENHQHVGSGDSISSTSMVPNLDLSSQTFHSPEHDIGILPLRASHLAVSRDSENFDAVVSLAHALHLRHKNDPDGLHLAVRRVIDAVFPSTILRIARIFVRKYPDVSLKLFAAVASLATTWLVGKSDVNDQGRGVSVQRCRILEATGCASVCVHACKVPTETFFKDKMGLDVWLEPNYDDFSCQFHFGVKPPDQKDDPTFKEPCFSQCPVKDHKRNQSPNQVVCG